jgi:hypothetical protein
MFPGYLVDRERDLLHLALDDLDLVREFVVLHDLDGGLDNVGHVHTDDLKLGKIRGNQINSGKMSSHDFYIDEYSALSDNGRNFYYTKT